MYNRFFALSPNLLCTINLNGCIQASNPAWKTTLGLPQSKLLNQPFIKVVHPDDSSAAAQHLQKHSTGADVVSFETRCRTQDGSYRWFLWNTQLYPEEQLIYAIGQDISERKGVEPNPRALTETQQLYPVSHSLPSQDTLADILQTIVSQAAEALSADRVSLTTIDQDQRQVLLFIEGGPQGESKDDFDPETLFAEFMEGLTGWVMQQQKPALSTRAMLPDFRESKRVQAIRTHAEAGSIIVVPLIYKGQILGTMTAINHLDKADFRQKDVELMAALADQSAIALENARLLQTYQPMITAIEQTIESIVITDIQGVIIYVNPAFERTTGYSQDEVIGLKMNLLKSGRHDAAFYQDLWDTISRGQTWQGRIINKNKAGMFLTEDTTITPVRDEEGVIVNYVAVKHDVTHELELEEQLRQSQKMESLGKLAGGMAHDFNNLLMIINGYSELVLRRYLSEQTPWRKYINEIHRAGGRAADLIQQLLVFSRKQVLEPKVLDLNEVVANVEKMLQRLISENIGLETTFGAKQGFVKVDPGQIEQVILNIVFNACDAMPRGGTLLIETQNYVLSKSKAQRRINAEPGPYVQLSIKDTGIGMAPETKTRIFEPFFTTKAKGKGTGLGLATTYSIIHQSGGHIRVQSSLGKGTTFEVYLPQMDAPASQNEVSPQRNEGQHHGSETILLVEDEANVREFIGRLLAQEGYTIIQASNGSEALTLCQQQTPSLDLLITDVVMPKMGGPTLVEHLAPLYPDIKVIYISGYTDKTTIEPKMYGLQTTFLQKPFTSNNLTHKIRAILDDAYV